MNQNEIHFQKESELNLKQITIMEVICFIRGEIWTLLINSKLNLFERIYATKGMLAFIEQQKRKKKYEKDNEEDKGFIRVL